MNVGSGGGAAAAPTSGGAAAGGDAGAAEEKAEEKEEGKDHIIHVVKMMHSTNNFNREGGVRRGYGLRSLRLNSLRIFSVCTSNAWPRFSLRCKMAGWSSSFL